ncbi:MAG: 2-C-methyl-D-erythritol 4-phosphate cytidylyltransferase [Burkholderiaceae bacterium]|nr:2-C-methyl-D-erythritol 4-phosphate cytidylyltransferase [Burkholderiaceae bacterium]
MHESRYFAVIPAAGVGARLGAGLPKQYLEIAGKPILRWAVDALCAAPWIERIVVVVAPGDSVACGLLRGLQQVRVSDEGGATRRDSVLAGMCALGPLAAAQDWILVHDAARPGLGIRELEALRAFAESPVARATPEAGALLGLQATDTIKRAVPGVGAVRVAETIPRDRVWMAQTPQMFRAGVLRTALEHHPDVTDEAAAMEASGHPVHLVPGSRTNFKVTEALDLDLMRAVLANRSATESVDKGALQQ